MKSKILFIAFVFVLIASLALAACGGLPAATSTDAPVVLGNNADPRATLLDVVGDVQIKNPGAAAFTAAEDGDRLEVGGQLSTGQDSTVRLDLASGTIVRVAPESMFTLNSNEVADGSLLTQLILAAGRVWVVLRGGALEVETPSGVASVRGSYMSVWVDPETADVWVTCLEGWCQAENPAAVMDMVAGEGCLLYHWDPEGTTPPPPPKLRYLTQADIDEFLSNNPEAQEVMNAIIATASALPTLAPTPESTPVTDCFTLGLPENGASVSETGEIQFDWNDQPEAFKYILHVIKPNGSEKNFLSWRSSLIVDADELPYAGEYQWEVIAYNSNIQPICTAGPWTFTKAAAPEPTPVADCFQLTAPDDGAQFSETDPITFTWEEQPDRYKYVIHITKPNGADFSKILFTNTYQTGAEALGMGGTYSWSVTAYDANIDPICTSGPRTFSLPGDYVPPTPEPGSCVTLLSPADGTNFPGPAAVEFTWTEYPGAYKYIISFKPPSTPASTFLAWEPSHLRYVESFTEGGTYQWWVTVKDQNLNEICTSGIFTFTKPTTIYPTPSQKPGDDTSPQNGLYWGHNVSLSGCSVSASAYTAYGSGVKKFVLSTSPIPPTTPYVTLSDYGGGLWGTNVDVCTWGNVPAGTTIYWRFEIYDGEYLVDSTIGSFVTSQDCP